MRQGIVFVMLLGLTFHTGKVVEYLNTYEIHRNHKDLKAAIVVMESNILPVMEK